jgi:hypothetical protein
VLEEGTGAIIHYQRDCDTTNALVYDLGNGTLIVSGFSGLKMTDRRYSQNGGVESLIEAVATNEQVRCKLLKEGDRHLIRAGIESRSFTYGTQYPDWDFKPAYKAELPLWVDRVLKPMVRPDRRPHGLCDRPDCDRGWGLPTRNRGAAGQAQHPSALRSPLGKRSWPVCLRRSQSCQPVGGE